MIEITSFLLKHLYELMADDYNARHGDQQQRQQLQRQSRSRRTQQSQVEAPISAGRSQETLEEFATTIEEEVLASQQQSYQRSQSRDQETNQQIVSFLANNHLPDLICETFIELLFICVFLAVTWIFVMIVQLHCHQLQQPARLFYCNTKFLASLMYCNNRSRLAAA